MRLTPVRTLAPALLVLAVAVTGCSGGADDAGDASSGSVAGAPAPAQAERNLADSNARGDGQAFGVEDVAESQPNPAGPQQALIKKGNVALRADDVGKTQFEVQGVVDDHGGSVTEEKTTTDDDGAPAYTRMVLRIPAADFDDAMTELKSIEGAELESANTSEEDVTTKLIDTRTRIRVQRRSIERITVLFDRAQSIRDIMAIEAQLSRRQADLDSLERQAAYLQNQTSLSTIVVSVDQIPEKRAIKQKDDDTGFLAGLSAGWHGLTKFAVAMATVFGALLPWMVLLLVLGVPTLLLLRRVRHRRSDPVLPEPSEG